MHPVNPNTAGTYRAIRPSRSRSLTTSSRLWSGISCMPILVMVACAVHIARTPSVTWMPVLGVVAVALLAQCLAVLRDRSRFMHAARMRDIMPKAHVLPLPEHPGPVAPPMLTHGPVELPFIRVT